jgi:predicted  nucleic acid-binding Zn-ribbon protein
MGIEDTVQVRCTRCKTKFRDKARRLRAGYSRQCPSCECMVFFEDDSPNKDIRDAMRDAERVRKALREEEAEKIAARATAATEQAHADEHDPENAPVVSRRQIERRSFPGGRSRS